MNIFLVEESCEGVVPLCDALESCGHSIVHHASLENAILLEIAMRESIDVVLFNLESIDKEILRKLCALSDVRPTPVIVFVKSSDPSMTRLAIKSGISAYIIDGFENERLESVIDLAIARFEEIHALQEEVKRLKKQLEERKLIERAKGVLMTASRMSEAEAYASMRKHSMDHNRKLAEVAGEVLAAMGLPDKAENALCL